MRSFTEYSGLNPSPPPHPFATSVKEHNVELLGGLAPVLGSSLRGFSFTKIGYGRESRVLHRYGDLYINIGLACAVLDAVAASIGKIESVAV